LFNKFVFHTNVMLAVDTAVEKNVQSTKPASANRGYDTPPVLGCNRRANTKEKISAGSVGCTITQRTPSRRSWNLSRRSRSVR
jgi:hypothetical protein